MGCRPWCTWVAGSDTYGCMLHTASSTEKQARHIAPAATLLCTRSCCDLTVHQKLLRPYCAPEAAAALLCRHSPSHRRTASWRRGRAGCASSTPTWRGSAESAAAGLKASSWAWQRQRRPPPAPLRLEAPSRLRTTALWGSRVTSRATAVSSCFGRQGSLEPLRGAAPKLPVPPPSPLRRGVEYFDLFDELVEPDTLILKPAYLDISDLNIHVSGQTPTPERADPNPSPRPQPLASTQILTPTPDPRAITRLSTPTRNMGRGPGQLEAVTARSRGCNRVYHR